MDPLPAAHTTLAVQDLVGVLWPDYHLAAPTGCRLLQDGLNAHYLVGTADGDYVLRVYRHGWRTVDDIGYEPAVLTHLDACSVPVCAPIARRDGLRQSVIPSVEGPRVAALLRYAPGHKPDATDPEVVHALGGIMALIHHHTDGFTCEFQRFPLGLEHLIDQPLGVVIPLLAHRQADATFVQGIAQRLHAGLAVQADGLEWGYCHGDFTGGNAHLDTDGSLRVFDFDCGGPGWRAYDLAVCRLFCDTGGTWEAFCEGYEEVRSIPDSTRAAIPWFLVTRQLWRMGLFAASWSHLTGSPVDDAFFDQHLGILRDRISAQLPGLDVE